MATPIHFGRPSSPCPAFLSKRPSQCTWRSPASLGSGLSADWLIFMQWLSQPRTLPFEQPSTNGDGVRPLPSSHGSLPEASVPKSLIPLLPLTIPLFTCLLCSLHSTLRSANCLGPLLALPDRVTCGRRHIKQRRCIPQHLPKQANLWTLCLCPQKLLPGARPGAWGMSWDPSQSPWPDEVTESWSLPPGEPCANRRRHRIWDSQ